MTVFFGEVYLMHVMPNDCVCASTGLSVPGTAICLARAPQWHYMSWGKIGGKIGGMINVASCFLPPTPLSCAGVEALERLHVVLAVSEAQQAAVVQGILSNNAYG